MKSDLQKHNWLIDAVLFGAFILSFFLDLTGLPLHQWLGLAVGGLVLYHLARHRNWVSAVGQRLSERLTSRAGGYFLIDFGLLFGFASIILSGVLISTWLDLVWANMAVVWAFHVVSSLLTLSLLLVKIGLHAGWILRTARERVFTARRGVAGPPGVASPSVNDARGRREFLKLMGAVGAVSLIALVNGASSLSQASASQRSTSEDLGEIVAPQSSATVSTPLEAANTATPSAAAQSVSQASAQVGSSQTCSVRCPRGCSYPGHCRRYTDANNDGKCDQGECV
ncbi:hypothetical protein LARV_00205 [Longilinea arvoryzae]|uniref:DUF4405 domain-containing protein n=1 Tax=Longilinea arvoryzae TaxID=360412 RepID=A0A0S7BDN8_9CHLR|nr:hypothetical protein [Longilinea arvoryzae]GAP12470.1 hypothetical protein LARV_00205 [Longilinea arvoryzae]